MPVLQHQQALPQPIRLQRKKIDYDLIKVKAIPNKAYQRKNDCCDDEYNCAFASRPIGSITVSIENNIICYVRL